jgi:hypothetical protein
MLSCGRVNILNVHLEKYNKNPPPPSKRYWFQSLLNYICFFMSTFVECIIENHSNETSSATIISNICIKLLTLWGRRLLLSPNIRMQKILVILRLDWNPITLVLIWKVLRQAFRWSHYFLNPSTFGELYHFLKFSQNTFSL